MSDYWKDFIPAVRTTRLGDCACGDPELAAAWLGWQACEAKLAAKSRARDAEKMETELRAECERLRLDAARMDWLVIHEVEVSTPWRYGSRRTSEANVDDSYEDAPPLPSNLRDLIDAQLTKEQPT